MALMLRACMLRSTAVTRIYLPCSSKAFRCVKRSVSWARRASHCGSNNCIFTLASVGIRALVELTNAVDEVGWIRSSGKATE